ncbi:MAG: lytic transglycosylase domain-containing protein [Vampirovibrionales bacterium]
MDRLSSFQEMQSQSGLDQAKVRRQQLASLKAALLAKAEAQGLAPTAQTFRQLLSEELQRSTKPAPPTEVTPTSSTPWPPVKRPNVDPVERGDTLAPFPFATKAGKTTVTTAGSSTQRQQRLAPAVQEMSQRYGLDPLLVHAVIMQESGYQPKAVSGAGALGFMQLMPGTAKSLGVSDPMNPLQNLEGGVKYLAQQVQRFGGNIPMALAAYNAGPNAVAKYGGIPPYSETKNYVRSILVNYLKSKSYGG